MELNICFVGMPGTGKTTLANYFAKKYGKPVVSSDHLIDSQTPDSEHPITRRFMANFEERFGADYAAATQASSRHFPHNLPGTGFRDFEEFFIVNAFQGGMFAGTIPDLGGGAFMRQPTRQAIVDSGFTSIYLETDTETLVRNLSADYDAIKAGGPMGRSNYFRAAEAAVAQGASPYDAMRVFSEEQRTERAHIYALAERTVTIGYADSVADIALRVEALFPGRPADEPAAQARQATL